MVGDFNFPDINWSSMSGSCPRSSLFSETLFECNLTQLIDGPTHVKGNILDLVLTSDEQAITALQIHSEFDSPVKSDHLMISFSLLAKPKGIPRSKPRIVFDYSKADWSGLCDHLLDSDFSLCYEKDDVEIIWSVFKQIVISAMQLFIPMVCLKSTQYPCWFTPIFRHRHKCLKTLERKCLVNPSSSNFAKKRKAEEEFRLLAEEAKASYEGHLISKYGAGKS